MLDDRTKALLRAVLYPVQFEERPEAGIDRVIRQVVARQALHATPDDYLKAISVALESRDEKLAAIVPHSFSENVVRAYLQQLSAAVARARAVAVAGPAVGPLATS